MGDFEAKKGHVRLDGQEWPTRQNLDDDWEFAELVAEAESGSIGSAIAVAKLVLNNDTKAYEALKADAVVDGRVSAEKMRDLIAKIITASTSPN